MAYWVAHWAHTTALFTAAERGILISLTEAYWTNGDLPADEAVLARVARVTPEEWSSAKANVLSLFEITEGGRLRNDHIDREREQARLRSKGSREDGERGATKRWGEKSNVIKLPKR